MTLDPGNQCLGLVYLGADAMQSGNFGAAGQLFRMAEKQAASMPPGPALDFSLLVRSHVSLLRHRLGKTEEGKKLQDSAMTLLDENSSRMEAVAFQPSMAKVLMQLHEYRRAIPFCERAILRASKSKDPTAITGALARAAQCYGTMGLKDHSAVAARAALKILRDYPGDPRLPAALISLGNALRKSSPAEAESLYREAAELHEAKAQLESATPAWNNLGILCSKQGRHAEALEFYRKALHIREQTPSTPLVSIGRLLNNMASCYRRMGDFAEAHRLLDRAIKLLELDKLDGASVLASARGTRGLVLKDEGRDAEAVESFQLSYAERKSAPGPDFESMAEDLEEEIAALRRLGRLEEAVLAEDRLASVNAERNAIPHVDRDLSSRVSQAKGSVLVEIGYGGRPGNRYGKKDLEKLAVDFTDAAESRNAGFCAGTVTIPESTTLMLYGEDAEALFQAIQPILARERICEGASVTIRQEMEVREVILPGRVM
jgi:tetratricopeptide (TPR) repeat protein